MTNMMFVAYCIGSGMKATTCTLVGNKIGAGDQESSKLYFYVALLYTSTLIIIEIALLNIN